MQLAISADVLVPLGAGAVALLIALFVVLTRGWRKRTADPASADPAAEPTAADWTGEGANGPSDPVRPVVAEPSTPQPATPSTIAQPTTVAEAVAVREADTTPLPIQSDLLLARTTAAESAPDGDPAASTAAGRPAEPAADQPGEPAPAEPSVPPVAADAPVEHAGPVDGLSGVEEPEEADPPNWAAPPVVRPLSAGSSRTVGDAVTQALAARAVAASWAAADGAAEGAAAAAPADRPSDAPPRADARDRLLAVLLDDPVRAVGAAADLESCRDQLVRLTDAVCHERGVLAAVLQRLADAGLELDQIARLAGLPVDEVRALLEPSTRWT